MPNYSPLTSGSTSVHSSFGLHLSSLPSDKSGICWPDTARPGRRHCSAVSTVTSRRPSFLFAVEYSINNITFASTFHQHAAQTVSVIMVSIHEPRVYTGQMTTFGKARVQRFMFPLAHILSCMHISSVRSDSSVHCLFYTPRKAEY